jgi:hypothetical protein
MTATGWKIQDCQRQGILSFPKQPASYSVGNGFLPVEKQWEYEVDHPTSSSVEIKNKWSCTSVPHMYLHGADRDNCTFFNCCWRILLLYLRKEKEVEEDISCGLLYTVCVQCARSCLTCGTVSLNNFLIHDFLSFAQWIAASP